MIAIAKAPDVQLITDGADGWIAVPDLKLPAGTWRANAVPGFSATQIHITHGDQRSTIQMHGPHVYQGEDYYIFSGPPRTLGLLKASLGGQNVDRFVNALRRDADLVTWALALGWEPVRNGGGQVVSVMPPAGTVLCGHSGVDLDGDDIEEAKEI